MERDSRNLEHPSSSSSISESPLPSPIRRPPLYTDQEELQRTNLQMTNLRNVGFHKWEMLILKGSAYSGTKVVVYKSNERRKVEESRYRIIGNIVEILHMDNAKTTKKNVRNRTKCGVEID
ncbi:hypothetical protein NL676_014350 [Syzygium grande]|nr:hypothetical protein NL676_014350 [Syzygium grande]